MCARGFGVCGIMLSVREDLTLVTLYVQGGLAFAALCTVYTLCCIYTGFWRLWRYIVCTQGFWRLWRYVVCSRGFSVYDVILFVHGDLAFVTLCCVYMGILHLWHYVVCIWGFGVCGVKLCVYGDLAFVALRGEIGVCGIMLCVHGDMAFLVLYCVYMGIWHLLHYRVCTPKLVFVILCCVLHRYLVFVALYCVWTRYMACVHHGNLAFVALFCVYTGLWLFQRYVVCTRGLCVCTIRSDVHDDFDFVVLMLFVHGITVFVTLYCVYKVIWLLCYSVKG